MVGVELSRSRSDHNIDPVDPPRPSLGSSWAQKSFWNVYGVCLLIRSRFSGFLTDHFGGFWRPLGEVFGDILATFVVIDFIINLYMIFK